MKANLAVFVSGTGSLLEAMIKDGLEIKLVLADRPCRGLEIAKSAGIQVAFLPRIFGKRFNRERYTLQVLKSLLSYRIDIVAMAGFNTLLHKVIFTKYAGRILNTHPSLLPSFKGHYAVRNALRYGVKVTGCTIHIATEKMDKGPIVAQESVRVISSDTVDTLWECIKVVERKLYPSTIREFAKTLE